jgi:hypothetical protein
MPTVRELLERYSFDDAAVLRHGWVDYMRDYELLVSTVPGRGDSDIHRYQFVGCAEVTCQTALSPSTFTASLPDAFVFAGPDYADRDEPDGFIWGVRWAAAYPGLTYVVGGERATYWTEVLGRPMHELLLETNAFTLLLVFADVRHAIVDSAALPPKDYPIAVSPDDIAGDGL